MQIDEVEDKLPSLYQHAYQIVIFDWDNTLFCTKYLEMLNPDYDAIFSGRKCLEDYGSYLLDEIQVLEGVK